MKTIRYKHGVWNVLEPGKDILKFDSLEEAEAYVTPYVEEVVEVVEEEAYEEEAYVDYLPEIDLGD